MLCITLPPQQAAAGPACGCGAKHSASSDDDQQPEFVRFWLHNGFVNIDSEKMSKSLGNFLTIRDVLNAHHPAALRWLLAASHYRAPLQYSSRSLEEAADRAYYVYSTLHDAATEIAAQGYAAQAEVGGSSNLVADVTACLLDDLNTPGALAALVPVLKAVNDLLSTRAGRRNPQRLQLLAQHSTELLASLELLGLAPHDVGAALEDMRRLALRRAGLTQQQVRCMEGREGGRALVGIYTCTATAVAPCRSPWTMRRR